MLCEKVYLILMKEHKSASWACFRQLLLCKIWQRETDWPKTLEKKHKKSDWSQFNVVRHKVAGETQQEFFIVDHFATQTSKQESQKAKKK